MIKISELIPGDRIRLLSFTDTSMPYRRRLLSLGMTCGVEFSVIRLAPLGCPIQIEVRGASVTLRKEEASSLLLERL